MTTQHDIAPRQDDIDSPENLARRRHGQDVLSRIDGHQGEAVIDSLADISPALGHHVAAFAFGDIYDRPGLDARSRQLVTLGVLTALGGFWTSHSPAAFLFAECFSPQPGADRPPG